MISSSLPEQYVRPCRPLNSPARADHLHSSVWLQQPPLFSLITNPIFEVSPSQWLIRKVTHSYVWGRHFLVTSFFSVPHLSNTRLPVSFNNWVELQPHFTSALVHPGLCRTNISTGSLGEYCSRLVLERSLRHRIRLAVHTDGEVVEANSTGEIHQCHLALLLHGCMEYRATFMAVSSFSSHRLAITSLQWPARQPCQFCSSSACSMT